MDSSALGQLGIVAEPARLYVVVGSLVGPFGGSVGPDVSLGAAP